MPEFSSDNASSASSIAVTSSLDLSFWSARSARNRDWADERLVALHLSLLPPGLGKQSLRFGRFLELVRNTALLLGFLLAVLCELPLLFRLLLPLLRDVALLFGLLAFVLGKLPLAGGAITLRERGHFGLLGCPLGGAGLEYCQEAMAATTASAAAAAMGSHSVSRYLRPRRASCFVADARQVARDDRARPLPALQDTIVGEANCRNTTLFRMQQDARLDQRIDQPACRCIRRRLDQRRGANGEQRATGIVGCGLHAPGSPIGAGAAAGRRPRLPRPGKRALRRPVDGAADAADRIIGGKCQGAAPGRHLPLREQSLQGELQRRQRVDAGGVAQHSFVEPLTRGVRLIDEAGRFRRLADDLGELRGARRGEVVVGARMP